MSKKLTSEQAAQRQAEETEAWGVERNPFEPDGAYFRRVASHYRELAAKPEREDDQMFTDEFIGEVIGIDLLRDFEIHLPGQHTTLNDQSVRAFVSMGRGPHFDRNEFTGHGKTMGFALRDVRNQIKDHYGR